MSSVSHASASLKSASGAGTFASVIDLLGRLREAAGIDHGTKDRHFLKAVHGLERLLLREEQCIDHRSIYPLIIHQ